MIIGQLTAVPVIKKKSWLRDIFIRHLDKQELNFYPFKSLQRRHGKEVLVKKININSNPLIELEYVWHSEMTRIAKWRHSKTTAYMQMYILP